MGFYSHISFIILYGESKWAAEAVVWFILFEFIYLPVLIKILLVFGLQKKFYNSLEKEKTIVNRKDANCKLMAKSQFLLNSIRYSSEKS